MMLLCLIILVCYILIKLILYFIVRKYGKFSFDGFSSIGFVYDSENDIFYSSKNAWQKNFGYTHMYDVLAPLFRMIIDTEPIRFYYNNKNWLITFWKGQYGIATGAEIGIYCTDQKMVDRKTIYLPVSNGEMLNMYIILYKDKEIVAKIAAKHWWLAIFKLGMFSNPKALSMDINITFCDQQMLEAFLESFKQLGYTSSDFKIIDNTFCFRYIKPRTRKVWTRWWLADIIRQFLNRKNVELYNKYLIGLIDNNKIDDSKTNARKRVIIINEFFPKILKNIPENKIYLGKNVKKILVEKEKNIIFLNSNVYSGIEGRKHE